MATALTSRFSLITLALGAGTSAAIAQIQGQHHLTWWDDPNAGVIVTQRGAPPPTAQAVPLFHMDEWHLSQVATANWYNGLPVVGLPVNPFNAANRNGMTVGSAIAPVNNAEGFIYQVTNVNYFNGNGPPPFQAPPFSFSTPPGNMGQNDLSGINIVDSHGALAFTAPAGGSQFMFSHNLIVGSILDLTPASAGVVNSQDWDFNAYTGPGNWEWDIDTAGIGASIALQPIVFGYAMPGVWLDAINAGHAHSWSIAAGAPPLQVNVAGSNAGWSGPAIPTPSAMTLLGIAGAISTRRRR